MAEFGAHLTGVDSGGNQPSIFEVLAQETLVTSLQPAFRYIAQILSERNPQRYGFLCRYTDEIHALLGLVLEQHYLKKYDSSFAENFYGMRRVPSAAVKNCSGSDAGLPNRVIFRSLVSLVGFPYLKNKCEKWYEELNRNKEQVKGKAHLKGQLCRAFLAVYPILHATWEGLNLFYQMSYIFGKSKTHSPLLVISGVFLRNLTGDEEFFQDSFTSDSFQKRGLLGKLLLFLQNIPAILAIVLSHAFSTSVFFLQFLEWWYASDQRPSSLTSLPVPVAPKEILSKRLPSQDVCPVCLKQRTNDSALQTSGYVFCYPCIYRYVARHNRCPVTGCPSRTDSIIKLYKPD